MIKKFLNINSHLFRTINLTLLVLFFSNLTLAQNTPEKTSDPKGKVIDRVVAIVGNSVILESDIANQYLNMRMQGQVNGDEHTVKCNILENQLYQKLMVTEAKFDSLKVDDSQVNNEVSSRLGSFINHFGSQEKMEKYYGKPVNKIKADLHDMIKDQLLGQQVQQKIIGNVTVTPSEIANYYNNMPKDSIPLVKTEYVVRQLVLEPPISVQERLRVKKRLLDLRKRILNGESFSTLAILYSEDPGSAKKGGELGFFGHGQLYPEFEKAAYKLKPGQVSDVVKTKAGYHIIQMIQRKGDYINVRHILLVPKVSPVVLQKAKEKLDSIAELIRSDSLTFNKAVKEFSQGPNKNNGGYLINPQTGGVEFEGEQLPPNVSYIINDLKPGEISNPVPFTTDDQKQAYRILYLEKKIPAHRANLKLDYDKIENWALMAKRQKAIDKWINEKAALTYIKIIPAYQSCHFKHKWIN